MRKPVAVFAVYIPPRTSATERKAIAEALAAEAADISGKFKDPAIFIGGDFNHASVGEALAEVGPFVEIDTGPTRGNDKLDIMYTNIAGSITEAGTLPPLQANLGAISDHKCVYAVADLGQDKDFSWVVRMSRKRDPHREEAFAKDLMEWRLGEQLGESQSDVDQMALELENKIAELTERHFPLQQVRRRSNEDPWITRNIRRLWKKKLQIYKKGGRNNDWWATDSALQDAIETSKESYVERLLEEGSSSRSFYSATKKLASATSCREWRVSDLFSGKDGRKVGT